MIKTLVLGGGKRTIETGYEQFYIVSNLLKNPDSKCLVSK